LILATITFTENERDFDDMIKVWEKSAAYYMSDAKRVVLKVAPPKDKKRSCDKYMRYSSTYAYIQMASWALKQDDDLILTDCDIMFTGDCKEVFDQKFNFACTVRDASCWVNAGVIFIKNNRKGKKLLRDSIQLSKEIYRRPGKFSEELIQFLGADQAAIALLAKEDKIKKLPCAEWNCEQHSWDKFSRKTKIVHMKSSLWDLAHGELMRSSYDEDHNIYQIFKIWKGFLED
jgi:lipopolysaccharide biosynthesis glycosyltransferase